MAKAKRWKDAKEFYTQAIAVILKKEEVEKDLTGIAEHSANPKSEEEQEAETRKEEEVEEACYINRALCNLELSMFSTCDSLNHCYMNFSTLILPLRKL